MFANVAGAYLWGWTAVGAALEIIFQILPVALGLRSTIDAGLARVFFSWTLHAIVYFWLIPTYIAYYTIFPRAIGGRLYSDAMARIAFILFVVVAMPIGVHHLFADPQVGAGFKFMHSVFTGLVALPTLLTVFTICASAEIASRLRGGRGAFGWVSALPWQNPIMLATALSLVMLGFGGAGGLINMSYQLDASIHNTQWITGHFHLIFGGAIVIMYFAIAYDLWPHLTGRALESFGLMRTQLWLWFIGMIVTTFPWHYVGILGMPRRMAFYDYANPAISPQAFSVSMSAIGGFILLVSGILFLTVLVRGQRSAAQRGGRLPVRRALAHAGADPGRAEQLWAVACADDRPHRRQLRLSDRAIDGAEGNQRARGLCRSEPMSEQPLFSLRNPWFSASVGVTAAIAVLAAFAGLIWLPLAQPDLKLSGIWDAICSAAGVPRASSQADAIQPDFKTSNVVMTSEMLTRHDQVSIGRGATLAQRCAICHGPQGVSDANSPNLAGQFAAVTYKELNDFKTGARVNVVMSPFAANLSNQDMLDIAAYYAYLPRVPSNKLDPALAAPAIVTIGAPMRNIAPCGSCHGDIDNKAGSPWLGGQSAVYIKAQLQAFAAGTRRNDISQQMRNIARQMTAEEIDAGRPLLRSPAVTGGRAWPAP